MHTWQKRVSWLIGGGGLLAAVLLVAAPYLPQWGELHTPHEAARFQQLKTGQTISQTFSAEYPRLDGVRLILDTTHTIPQDGSLQVEVRTTKGSATQAVSLAEVDPDGNIFLWLTSPLKVTVGTEGRMTVSLVGTNAPIYLRYQIDATIYPGGEMTHSARRAEGDLAFAFHYQRPGLGSMVFQVGYALLILTASMVLAWGLRQPWWSNSLFVKRDVWWSLTVGLIVFAWYAAWLVRGGIWIGPGDFVKDVSYIKAGASAVQLGSWPVWSHLICGGMPLIGNPEANVLSIGTLFALVWPAETSLWLVLALEAGIGAAGSFLLARSFGISRLGSVLAALVPTLSGAYPYRIVEGFTMIGAAVAYLPWVVLGVIETWKEKGIGWSVVAGAGLTLMFWRGEVHILTGLLCVLGILMIVALWNRRSWRPLMGMCIVGAVFFLGGSVKLLAYLEQPRFFAADYHPYVALLIPDGILDDVFLQVHSRFYPVEVRHGEYPEEWGNFGAYVGWLVIFLTVLGCWQRRPWWWFIVGGAAVAFVLSEGSLFYWLLSDMGPLAGLLRIPTRLMAIVLVFGGVVAGAGVDRISQWIGGKTGMWVALALLVAVGADLMVAQTFIFSEQLGKRVDAPTQSVSVPTLAFHRNAGVDDSLHAGVLLVQGYALPRLCADVVAEPEFVAEEKEGPFPLTYASVTLLPNKIRVSGATQPRVVINERFTANIVASQGVAYEGTQGQIVVDMPRGAYEYIYVVYPSATSHTQQFLLAFSVVIVGVVCFPPRRFLP